MTYYSTPPRSDELWHHGIKGMHWGVRKYQNEDGSLTPAGERHYYKKGYIDKNGKLTKSGYNRGYRQDSNTNVISKHKSKLRNPNYGRQRTVQVVKQMAKRGDQDASYYAQKYNVNISSKPKNRRKRALSFLTKVQTQQRKPKVYVPIRF